MSTACGMFVISACLDFEEKILFVRCVTSKSCRFTIAWICFRTPPPSLWILVDAQLRHNGELLALALTTSNNDSENIRKNIQAMLNFNTFTVRYGERLPQEKEQSKYNEALNIFCLVRTNKCSGLFVFETEAQTLFRDKKHIKTFCKI